MSKDWPEDAVHENGSYSCLCSQCLSHFVGLKRRTLCKECHTKAYPPMAAVEETRRFLIEQCAKEGAPIRYANVDMTKVAMQIYRIGQVFTEFGPHVPENPMDVPQAKVDAFRAMISTRFLGRILTSYGRAGHDVHEFLLEDVSPSGQWVKLRNSNGKRSWHDSNRVEVVEPLHTEPKPQTV